MRRVGQTVTIEPPFHDGTIVLDTLSPCDEAGMWPTLGPDILDGCGVVEPDDPNLQYVTVRMPRATWLRLEAARRA